MVTQASSGNAPRPGSGPRVVYLALDACDPGIATGLAAEGRMPTLARLLDEGARVATRAPAGVFVSAQWPTLVTARDPARHGYFCWKQFVPGSYDDVLTTPDLVDGVPLWERLSDAGRRVAVVDVPHSRAPERLNGVMLVEWGCHDRHFGPHSFPVDLVDEVNERFGAHPVGTIDPPHRGWDQFAPCDYLHRDGWASRTPAQQETMWRTLVDGQERKRKVSLDLLDREPWDLFMSVLGESHCVGHQFWSVHDPTHPWHDPAVRERIGDPLVEMYSRLDSAVADHLDRLRPDTTVYLHLSHGMGPHFDGQHLLDDVLRRMAAADAGGRLHRARGLAATVARLGGPGAARPLAGLVRRRVTGAPPDLGPDPDPVGGDRAERPWFAIPNNTVTGAVRLNVIGREPRGIVAPGADVEAACDRLTRWLRELVNVDTGEPVVVDVVRTDAAYRRHAGDALPDLLVEWNRRHPIERVWSPRIGLVERAATHWRTGDHTPHGLLVARGPGIAPGDRGTADVVHVGATVAAAVGVPLDDVDGRPLAGLVPTPVGTRTTPPAGEATVAGAASRAVADGPSAHPVPTAARRTLGAAGRVLDATGRSARRRLEERVMAHARVLAGRIDLLGDAHHATRALAHEAVDHAHRLHGTTDELATAAGALDVRVTRLERAAMIRTVTAWVRAAAVPADLLVSIVVPTRDRAARLPRAIASVEAQAYDHWELIVVDDGSTDGTAALLEAVSDPRVRVLRTDGIGCAAARNVALDRATGDVVVYLDDDNVLDPLWCKAVAWAFGQRPDVDVLYGARLIDDIDRVLGVGTGALPVIQFEPFDRTALERGNIADMGVMAHRIGIDGARFDADLDAHADWDLLLRLTEGRTPLELPVVACYYTSDAPGRLSDGDLGDVDLVRARLAARTGTTADAAEEVRPR